MSQQGSQLSIEALRDLYSRIDKKRRFMKRLKHMLRGIDEEADLDI